MVLENRVCPKAFAIQTQASDHPHHQCPAWSCLLDSILPFPNGELSTDAHALWHLSVTGFCQSAVDVLGFIQDSLCCPLAYVIF